MYDSPVSISSESRNVFNIHTSFSVYISCFQEGSFGRNWDHFACLYLSSPQAGPSRRRSEQPSSGVPPTTGRPRREPSNWCASTNRTWVWKSSSSTNFQRKMEHEKLMLDMTHSGHSGILAKSILYLKPLVPWTCFLSWRDPQFAMGYPSPQGWSKPCSRQLPVNTKSYVCEHKVAWANCSCCACVEHKVVLISSRGILIPSWTVKQRMDAKVLSFMIPQAASNSSGAFAKTETSMQSCSTNVCHCSDLFVSFVSKCASSMDWCVRFLSTLESWWCMNPTKLWSVWCLSSFLRSRSCVYVLSTRDQSHSQKTGRK